MWRCWSQSIGDKIVLRTFLTMISKFFFNHFFHVIGWNELPYFTPSAVMPTNKNSYVTSGINARAKCQLVCFYQQGKFKVDEGTKTLSERILALLSHFCGAAICDSCRADAAGQTLLYRRVLTPVPSLDSGAESGFRHCHQRTLHPYYSTFGVL